MPALRQSQILRVHRIEWAAEDTILVDIRHPLGQALTPFTAGAHVEVSLPIGVRRAYSLANNPAESHRYVFAVLLDHRSESSSRWWHRDLRVGDTLELRGPHNRFPLEEDAKHSVLIGGGIGVAPILTMAYRLKTLGRSFDLHYAVRDIRHAALIDEVKAVCEGRFSLHDDARLGHPLDIAEIVAGADPQTHFYFCGPLHLLKVFEDATAERPDYNVHVEYFKVPPLQAPASAQR